MRVSEVITIRNSLRLIGLRYLVSVPSQKLSSSAGPPLLQRSLCAPGQLVDRFTRLRNAGMLTFEEMAQRLNLCSRSVQDWRDLGWLRDTAAMTEASASTSCVVPTCPKRAPGG